MDTALRTASGPLAKLFAVLIIAVVLATRLQAQDSLTNGLVAYYPFRGNANDESGATNHGTVYNAQLCADRFGTPASAYQFDSSRLSAIYVTPRGFPGGNAARSLSLWLRTVPKYPTTAFLKSVLFEQTGAAGSHLLGTFIYQPVAGVGSLFLESPTDVWGTWKSGWDFAAWHHVVWVVPVTNQQTQLYVDGTVQAFDDPPAANLVLNTGTNAFWLGYGEGNYLDGALDDVRIYDRALSAAEVSLLYAAEAPTNTGSPTIVAQPRDQAGRQGGEAVFTVTANGQQPILVQWQFNGAAVAGATNSTLRLTNLQTTAAGAYKALLSNDVGTATSPAARLTVAAATPGGAAPTNGLLAYYPFNGNANDESGHGANGTNYGALLTADRFGQANRAYYFNPTNLSGIVANVPGLPTNEAPRTLSLWFRSDWPSDAAPDAGSFFGYGGYPNTSGWFGLRALSYNWANVLLWDGQWSCGVVPTADGQWHQVVFTVLSNTPSLYLDGVGLPWQSFPPVGTRINSGGGPFQIGSYGGEFFSGALDDLRIYDRALSEQEILQLYAAEAPANSGPPVVVRDPVDATVLAGGNVTFTVAANGQAPLFYQWFANGAALSGATNAVLRLTKVPTNSDDYYDVDYRVVISNALGVVTSAVARLAVLTPTLGGPPPTNGLVAYYSFNGNAHDDSGNGGDGVVNGATLTVDRFGIFGRAYYFNLTNLSRITAQVSGLPTGGAPRTISLWYRTDWSSQTTDRIGYLFGYGGSTNVAGWFGVRALSYNWLTTALYNGQWVGYPIPMSDGRWHQAVLVLAGNVPTIYVDGWAQTWDSYPLLGTQVDSGGNPFQIGSYGSEYFDGSLDDVRIYNRALTSVEVNQLYHAELPPPPVIVTQPQSAAAGLGGTATFSVTASGAPPLTYQWRREGIPLPLATGDALVLAGLQPQQAGNYSVVVSNDYGSVTSSVAVLSITNSSSTLWQGLVAWYPFTGNAQDQSGFGDHGVVQGATLVADRTGTPNAAYEFVASNHATISASGLALPRADAPRTLAFWFKARPLNAAVTSQEYPLGWGSFAYPGSGFAAILTSANAFGVAGNAAPVRTTAFRLLDDVWHYAVLTFAGGTNCAGFIDGFACNFGSTAPAALWNTASGSLTLGSFVNSGWFDGRLDDIRIYNRALSSAEAQRLYIQEVGYGPRITNTVSASVSLGQAATLSVTAVGTPPLSYQWFDRYDVPVAGATNASLAIAYAGATNLGQYRVVVSNAWGLASAPATLTVANPYSPVYLPLANVLPGSEHVSLMPNGDLESVAGTNASGEILATSWSVSGHLTLGPGTNATPANGHYVSVAYPSTNTASSRYQRIALEPNTEYVLSGYVWNMGDPTNRVNTALDATDVAWDPQINFGPQYAQADRGYFVYCRFHSGASGTNVQIRAFYDGFAGSGASARYYPLAAQWDNIAVTKAVDFVPPTITVPILISQPQDRTVVATSSLQLSVLVRSTLPPSCQWYKDGQVLAAATSRILTLTNVGAQDAGTYAVVVAGDSGAVTSSPARLTVQAMALPGIMAGPLTNPANRHLYYVLQPSSWVEAQGAAVQLGGGLATIRSAEEQAWIWGACRNLDTSHYFWIGLVDADPLVNSTNLLERRTEFRWVSGEPVSYSNWLALEPNNYQELGEFYGTLYPANSDSAGYWNDMYEAATTRGPGIAEVIPPPAVVAGPVSQTVTRGAEVTFSATVTGGLPLTYQWRKDGSDLPGATGATLTIDVAQFSDAGTYKLVVSNPSGTATSTGAELTVLTPLTLPEALNAPGYWWTTGGNRPWLPQTNVTADGISAAVSGTIADNQQTWVETIVNGPGQVAFKWKVSSEFGYDRLTFAIDSAMQATLSGEVDWTARTAAVPAGQHRLRWTYAKDGSEFDGRDLAWLDQVAYTPAPGVLQPVYLLNPQVRASNGLFQLDVQGEPGKTITIEVSTDLRSWAVLTTLANPNGSARFVDSQTPAHLIRYYRIRTP